MNITEIKRQDSAMLCKGRATVSWIFFPGIMALAFVSVTVAGFADDRTQPNILVLLADDLGYADVGFNGGTVIATPNLDRLAATGINLTDFRACPMCSPTRAGLMTGRWPIRFGIMRAVIPPWSTHGLPPEETTLPELLAEAGYEHRGIVGKWHLGHARRAFLPLRHGFTRFVGHYNGAIDYISHEREGELDWHHDDRTVRQDGYSTDLIGDEAVRFIGEAPEDSPWFLYVPFNAPHAPFQAKEGDLHKYVHIQEERHRAYAAMVDSMDQAVGRILTAVETRADAGNTIVLFFSDNGGVPGAGSSNGPFRGGKLTVYEGGTRVCAAIRWPAGGLSGGGIFEERIGYIDVLPTLVAAAGLEIPKHVDGVDVLPALLGKGNLPERPWFTYLHQSAESHAAVHHGRWKLVARGDFFAGAPAAAPEFELYDLSADAIESRDLAEARQAVVAKLSGALRRFGAWQSPGVGPYSQGRAGFKAPKDWIVFP